MDFKIISDFNIFNEVEFDNIDKRYNFFISSRKAEPDEYSYYHLGNFSNFIHLLVVIIPVLCFYIPNYFTFTFIGVIIGILIIIRKFLGNKYFKLFIYQVINIILFRNIRKQKRLYSRYSHTYEGMLDEKHDIGIGCEYHGFYSYRCIPKDSLYLKKIHQKPIVNKLLTCGDTYKNGSKEAIYQQNL